MKKRILIIYVCYGSGHKSAAQYVENYFSNQKEEYEIKLLNLSDYNTRLGKIGEALYSLNFKYKSSFLFTCVYKFFDHRLSTIPYKQVTNDLYEQDRLKSDIEEFNPNLTISTHFFGSILLSKYNKAKITNSKIITILTDYKSHEMWIRNFEHEDALIVPNEVIKNSLVNEGLDKNKIYPFGIPLSNKFSDISLKKSEVLKKYKLTKDLPIVSFMNGSVGSMGSYDYLKILLKKRYPIQVIMFCGKNQKLQNKCNELVKEKNYKNVLVLPFTTDVVNLINISDFVITKPGGLSITECLELKKPMLLIPGNGGPENYNAKFLVSKGYAINNSNLIKFNNNIKRVINYPSIIENMKVNLSNYQNNTSVMELYKLSKKLLKK